MNPALPLPARPLLAALTLSLAAGLAVPSARAGDAAPAAAPGKAPGAQVERGRYLVMTSACHDCHTPWKMGPNGPAPDMTRALSGHPQDFKVPPPSKLEAPWIAHSPPPTPPGPDRGA